MCREIGSNADCFVIIAENLAFQHIFTGPLFWWFQILIVPLHSVPVLTFD